MKAESQNIEYKESWRDEYLKWVCGFAKYRTAIFFYFFALVKMIKSNK